MFVGCQIVELLLGLDVFRVFVSLSLGLFLHAMGPRKRPAWQQHLQPGGNCSTCRTCATPTCASQRGDSWIMSAWTEDPCTFWWCGVCAQARLDFDEDLPAMDSQRMASQVRKL